MSKKHKHFQKQNVAKTYEHKCIKCKANYSDLDIEDYLCTECNASRLLIAKEIDAKFNTVGQKPSSDLTTYMNALGANGGKFPSISQMGIKW